MGKKREHRNECQADQGGQQGKFTPQRILVQWRNTEGGQGRQQRGGEGKRQQEPNKPNQKGGRAGRERTKEGGARRGYTPEHVYGQKCGSPRLAIGLGNG